MSDCLTATVEMPQALSLSYRCVRMSQAYTPPKMEPPAGEVTVLLHAWSAGDRSVEPRLFDLVLPDLRRLAQCLMRRERQDHSLQPTALLNETYCRLVKSRERDWQNRSHFFAVAAK